MNKKNNITNHGGARKGAGRKSDAERKNIVVAIDYLVNTEHLLMNLVEIAMDVEASNTDRIKASISLLDYRFGKAKQMVEMDVNNTLDGMTEKELTELRETKELISSIKNESISLN